MKKSGIEFLDCTQDCLKVNKKRDELIKEGYLLTGQSNWAMVYENPDFGNREDILKRHNRYMSICRKKDSLLKKVD